MSNSDIFDFLTSNSYFLNFCWWGSITNVNVYQGFHNDKKVEEHWSRVYFFNIWFGMVQHQKQFGCREGRNICKNILILQSWRRLPVAFTQNCSNFLLIFSSPSNFIAIHFVWSKRKIFSYLYNCAAYFTSYFIVHSRFLKAKVKSGFRCFWSDFVRKPGCFFWLGPITSTLAD